MRVGLPHGCKGEGDEPADWRRGERTVCGTVSTTVASSRPIQCLKHYSEVCAYDKGDQQRQTQQTAMYAAIFKGALAVRLARREECETTGTQDNLRMTPSRRRQTRYPAT